LKLEFSRQILKKTKISDFIKIRSVGAEMFHVDGRTDTTKLISAFRSFAKASKIGREICRWIIYDFITWRKKSFAVAVGLTVKRLPHTSHRSVQRNVLIIRTGSRAHQATYSNSTLSFILEGKAAGAWIWPPQFHLLFGLQMSGSVWPFTPYAFMVCTRTFNHFIPKFIRNLKKFSKECQTHKADSFSTANFLRPDYLYSKQHKTSRFNDFYSPLSVFSNVRKVYGIFLRPPAPSTIFESRDRLSTYLSTP
jgi:hypothetical protein